jgi:vacuolar-type H+-ATPase subunit H
MKDLVCAYFLRSGIGFSYGYLAGEVGLISAEKFSEIEKAGVVRLATDDEKSAHEIVLKVVADKKVFDERLETANKQAKKLIDDAIKKGNELVKEAKVGKKSGEAEAEEKAKREAQENLDEINRLAAEAEAEKLNNVPVEGSETKK